MKHTPYLFALLFLLGSSVATAATSVTTPKTAKNSVQANQYADADAKAADSATATTGTATGDAAAAGESKDDAEHPADGSADYPDAE